LVWFGLVWFGLVWFGLVWNRLDWSGEGSRTPSTKASNHGIYWIYKNETTHIPIHICFCLPRFRVIFTHIGIGAGGVLPVAIIRQPEQVL
jgi:hypothetical protein